MPAWIRVRLVAGLERRSGGATREVWLGNRDWMLRLNWLVIFYLLKFNDYNNLRARL